MKNLTIGKLALGVLMAFVLVMGVQGVADAVTLAKTDSGGAALSDPDITGPAGDLYTIAVNSNQTFSIYFTVTPTAAENITRTVSGVTQNVAQGTTTQIDPATGYKIAIVNGTTYRIIASQISSLYESDGTSGQRGVYVATSATHATADSPSTGNVYNSDGDQLYTDSGGTNAAIAYAAAPYPEAQWQHYNEQTVLIDIPSGITLTGPYAGTSDVTLTQTVTVTDGSKHPLGTTATTINVTGYATSVGKKTITIKDTTPSADRPTGDTAAPSLTFTIYVTRSNRDVPSTASIRLAGIRNGYAVGYYDHHGAQLFYNGDGSNYPVTYTIDGGTAYVRETDGRRTTAEATVRTSSAAKVYFIKAANATTRVTATIGGVTRSFVGAYINGYPTLPDIVVSPNPLSGTVGQVLAGALTARVNDENTASPGSAGAAVTGVPIKFEVKDKTRGGGNLVFDSTLTTDGSVGIIVDANNNEMLDANGARITKVTDKILHIRTDGAPPNAVVGFQIGTARKQEITVSAVGMTKVVTVTATNSLESGTELSVDDILSRSGGFDLYALVEEDGDPVKDSSYAVRFTTSHGQLTNTPLDGTGATSSTQVTDITDSQGLAQVFFQPNPSSGALEVFAELLNLGADNAIGGTGGDADSVIDQVTFNVSGSSTAPPTNQDARLTVSVSGTGANRTVEVAALDARGILRNGVVVSLSASSGTLSSTSVTTGSSSTGRAQSTLTLPSSGSVTITARATGYDQGTRTVTVQAVPDELVKVSGDDPPQTGAPGEALASDFVVRLEDRNNNRIAGQTVTFQVTGGGGRLSRSSQSTDPNGLARTRLTLGSSAGPNTVTASANGVTTVTFTATAASVANRLEISDGDNQRGELNTLLEESLVVQLLDANGDPIQGSTVEFWITEGSGTFSPNRRVLTDSQGFAEVDFRPRSHGNIEIEASVRGIDTITPVTFTITTGEPPAAIVLVSGNNQSGRPGTRLANPFVVEVVDENDDPVSGASVTFAVTAGGGSLSVTSVTTNGTGRAQTYLRLGDEVGENTVVARVTGLTAVTFTATSGAEVLVSAAQRPPMYWISRTEGKLHRLVDEEVENLAPNIDDILSLTVDTQNQLLYWTRQTAKNKSAIQRAGLNGRGVITLQTSLTLMTSIAVDSTGTTIYWADILGKIKSRPVQGNRVTLLAQNLSSPTGLVWANEYLYWGEATGQIRRMNLRNNRRTIETITTSSGQPVSLAVHSGRVYWTEISGNTAQLNRVNTNGTGVEALKTLTGSRRVWLDVDGSDSKIYLTRLTKLERRSLSGKSAKTLVESLQSPGSLVLGGTLPTGPPVVSQPTQPTQPAQPTVASKYDVNEDGKVNNADTRAVAGAVGQSGAAITNPRTDVDGSGTVDVTDLILVIANLDADVAAPAIDVDVKALDIDFDRVQEQVETLLASGDRSIAAQRALLYLQHLLASARPDETVLLANYPNPFNPETWIPYHLAESTDVRVNIYDAQGVLVRVLPLGHQTAGYYTSRSRAAYWDGLNALGERVASGIYFYQLQTDAVSPMRKMVILK